MEKKKLPSGVRFGYTDPHNLTPNITWSVYTLASTLSSLDLMYVDREMSLSDPFSEFRRSSYFTPPTFEEAKDMNEVYRKVAIDFAKYMRDHYR
jgi:hypothetical protein